MQLKAESKVADGGSMMREFYLADDDAEVLEELGQDVTVRELRRLEREYGDPQERIDILDSGLLCSECGDAIEERFSADIDGNPLCWDCSTERQLAARNGTDKAVDPTKTVLSDSQLYHKSLCDYVINVATGCSHGCKFCYVPNTPNISMREDMLKERTDISDGQRDWGNYLLYRDDLPERLARKLESKQKWNTTDRGRGVVMMSSGTDCYQDERTAQITRGCVAELIKYDREVRILTRSPIVTRDIDLFKESDGLVTVGSSIPCLDDERVGAIETSAPPPSKRLEALRQISSEGIRTYVSMSPTYPTQDKDDLRELMREFAELETLEVIFHEPINPRGGNFDMTINAAEEAGDKELAEELERIASSKAEWMKYSLDQLKWVEELGEELGMDIHIWPDRGLIQELREADSEDLQATGDRLEDVREEVSNENFAVKQTI